jgi:hypothetical protein
VFVVSDRLPDGLPASFTVRATGAGGVAGGIVGQNNNGVVTRALNLAIAPIAGGNVIRPIVGTGAPALTVPVPGTTNETRETSFFLRGWTLGTWMEYNRLEHQNGGFGQITYITNLFNFQQNYYDGFDWDELDWSSWVMPSGWMHSWVYPYPLIEGMPEPQEWQVIVEEQGWDPLPWDMDPPPWDMDAPPIAAGSDGLTESGDGFVTTGGLDAMGGFEVDGSADGSEPSKGIEKQESAENGDVTDGQDGAEFNEDTEDIVVDGEELEPVVGIDGSEEVNNGDNAPGDDVLGSEEGESGSAL